MYCIVGVLNFAWGLKGITTKETGNKNTSKVKYNNRQSWIGDSPTNFLAGNYFLLQSPRFIYLDFHKKNPILKSVCK